MKTPLTEVGIREFLKDSELSEHITVLDTVDSTNTYLKRNFTTETPTGTAVFANSQTCGRGRHGKSFYSPADTGLYMSVIFRAEDISDISMMTVAACTAVCRALEDTAGISPQIKWVNDIFCNGKKICGILTESVTNSENRKIDAVIVGIGLNITTTEFPKDICDTACSFGNDKTVRSEIAAAILEALIPECKNAADKNVIERYRERMMLLNKEIRYTLNGIEYSGSVLGTDDRGCLIVARSDGKTELLKSGEVSLGSKAFAESPKF